jgi:hypothetical protein
MFDWLKNIFEEIDYQLAQRRKDKLEMMKLQDQIETQNVALKIQTLSSRAAIFNAQADIKQIKLGGTNHGLVK